MTFPTTETEADEEVERLRELEDMDWGPWPVPDDEDSEGDPYNVMERDADEDDYPMPPDVLEECRAALESPDNTPPHFRWWRAIRRPGEGGSSREDIVRIKQRLEAGRLRVVAGLDALADTLADFLMAAAERLVNERRMGER
jgi:hypothetical protein